MPLKTSDHLSYFENDKNKLKYFLFKRNNTNQILMPIILREIENIDIDSKYFDAITPYGYSGPLFNSEVNEFDLKDNFN